MMGVGAGPSTKRIDRLFPAGRRRGGILACPRGGTGSHSNAAKLAARESRMRLRWSERPTTIARLIRFVQEFSSWRLSVVKLRVRTGETIQEAVKRFRKLCERSGLRKEMRRKAYYEKPSERRRREELKRLRKARQSSARV